MAIAGLPMYDLPALRPATDAWWAGLARALAEAGVSAVPERLTRERDLADLWRDPDLLLAQTCGYPLTHALAGTVRLVATPVYRAEGCEGAEYRSAFVVRADTPARDLSELRGRRVTINARDSQSGFNCLRHAVARLARGGRFFAEVVESGSHMASLAAVRGGRADVAAIDGVTLALLKDHDPGVVSGLRVLGWSAPAPGLPYVTAAGADEAQIARLRAGLRAAMEDPGLAEVRRALRLAGVEVLPWAAYDVIDEMEAEARAAGYPDVA